MKNMLCTWVKMSDGNRYQCEVLEWPIYDKDHHMPALGVRAINGNPFGGMNRAIVPMQFGLFTVKVENKI